ncbi:MAG: prohibitin family protein [Patescibacteria group bacterium]
MGYVTSVIIIIAIAAIAWYALKHFLSELFDRFKAAVAIVTAVLVLGVSVLNMPYQVPAGHVGIVYTFGGITGQRDEGLQWVAPWQDLHNASVQVQGHKFQKLASFSNETQDVFVDATINVQVSPKYIQELYRDVGANYFDILVRPRVLQAFKDETVKYTSVEVAPKREDIRKKVRERLTEELKTHSIAVQDLLVDNISFSKKFQDAIEEKQANTQLALAEKEKVAAEKHKASQKIEEARGQGQAILDVALKQAEANRKLAESITPTYIQYLFASKLAPNVQVMMIPSGQQFIMGADMFKQPMTDKK